MNCLKCGRETPGEQAFCLDCQLEMEKYPVKPGTVVQLPKRQDASASKKSGKRRVLSPEDQVKILKKRVRLLAVVLLVTLVLSALMVVPTVRYLQRNNFQIGQNYTSMKPTTDHTESVESTGK